MSIIDITMVAGVVSRELAERFNVGVGPAPYNEANHRSGDMTFSLPVEQKLGIFKMIMKEAHIRVQAGSVTSNEHGEHVSIMVALHYNHVSGGSNGSNIGTIWVTKEGELIGFREG